MHRLAPAIVIATAFAAAGARAADYVVVPAGEFQSVVAADFTSGSVKLASFEMRTVPVTREEFYGFVATHPQWRPDIVGSAFADAGYLADWTSLSALGSEERRQPVTHVSWFAAQAFCEAEGARLPTWSEWEYTAAADATRRDARGDPQWRAGILNWYARPGGDKLPVIGGTANVYGVRDLHGLVWEWVDDFNALLVDADSRSASDSDKLKFCGAGAISLKQRENYAVLMRVALLSSLKAADSTASLGFRCAKSLTKEPS